MKVFSKQLAGYCICFEEEILHIFYIVLIAMTLHMLKGKDNILFNICHYFYVTYFMYFMLCLKGFLYF